ncbi:nuclear receptor-like protein [Leptotrombidium deliense]|uniref:Nuclear receptor-like protein n=1 Tax=Leptotrombidium deliense TaxID=299467 RepID=A0A443SHY1_9ACAR|nr:nuclear receptor-like protein [Leptotrombidium deliense]
MGGNSVSKTCGNPEKDDTKGKCIICHPNGIVIAYSVFRCSICPHVSDCVHDSRVHYDRKHLKNNKLKETFGDFDPIILQLDKRCNNNDNDFRASTPCSEVVSDTVDHGVSLRPSTDSGVSIDPNGGQMFRSDIRSVSKLSINGTAKTIPICSVCRTQRQFACVQRRLGIYVCVYCFRFLRTFLSNPRIYTCPELGNCSIYEKKCDACWIKACIDVYITEVDDEKQCILRRYYPMPQLKMQSKSRSKLDLKELRDMRESVNGDVKSLKNASLIIDVENRDVKELYLNANGDKVDDLNVDNLKKDSSSAIINHLISN